MPISQIAHCRQAKAALNNEYKTDSGSEAVAARVIKCLQTGPDKVNESDLAAIPPPLLSLHQEGRHQGTSLPNLRTGDLNLLLSIQRDFEIQPK